eukprot:TRINITY_DN1385_c3_g1_i1.p1 TRINITY_DN1385_c3_g1~~TRINITY_DN1385_c3_g1_i1.p1  ORF type:complete len:867 (-),score=104.84 TRINITY_DN1385_c3_g1_i1:777-3377(-)
MTWSGSCANTRPRKRRKNWTHSATANAMRLPNSTRRLENSSSTSTYAPFQKDFWKPTELRSLDEVKALRKELQIRVSWTDSRTPPALVDRFDQMQFDAKLMRTIEAAEYKVPTAIQRQGIPIAMSGRDLIGIAKTGSGKTASFVLPMIVHVLARGPATKGQGAVGVIVAPTRELAHQIYLETKKFAKGHHLKVAPIFGGIANKRDQIQFLRKGVHILVSTPGRLIDMIVHVLARGPATKGQGAVGVIVAPTRELAHQIYLETKKFAKGHHLKVAPIFGGIANKRDQIQFLRKGVHILVSTPGRLIDMIRLKQAKMDRVSFLVLDEADRMFQMGFEPQVRSIVGQINPSRQTLLYSATFKRPIEELARDILTDPVRVTVGWNVGAANEDVHQVVNVFPNNDAKWPWLLERLPLMIQQGKVLIFGSTKLDCELLAKALSKQGYACGASHGDKNQVQRMQIMEKFKSGAVPILVATDVAARGLDVKDINTVVNYHIARNIESHTHRVGRTGRAGHKGVAYTLINADQSSFAVALVENLQQAKQYVSPELLAVAQKNPRYGQSSAEGVGGTWNGSTGKGKGKGGKKVFRKKENQAWSGPVPSVKSQLRSTGLGFGGKQLGGGPRFVKSEAHSIKAIPTLPTMAFVSAAPAPVTVKPTADSYNPDKELAPEHYGMTTAEHLALDMQERWGGKKSLGGRITAPAFQPPAVSRPTTTSSTTPSITTAPKSRITFAPVAPRGPELPSNIDFGRVRPRGLPHIGRAPSSQPQQQQQQSGGPASAALDRGASVPSGALYQRSSRSPSPTRRPSRSDYSRRHYSRSPPRRRRSRSPPRRRRSPSPSRSTRRSTSSRRRSPSPLPYRPSTRSRSPNRE